MNILDFSDPDSSIENNFLVHNKNIYQINIDYGTIKLGSSEFIFIMENSHIQLIEQNNQTMNNYFFKDCLFYMNSSIINIRRMVYNLSDCNIIITRGRILINNVYYNFTYENNLFSILNCNLILNNQFINNINESNTNVKNIIVQIQNHINLAENNNVYYFRNNINDELVEPDEFHDLLNDPQNVHRTEILDHFVHTFNILENRFLNILSKTILSNNLLLNEILNYVDKLRNKTSLFTLITYALNLKHSKRLHKLDIIQKVLQQIINNNGYIMKFDKTETYVLNIVWGNCVTNDLKDILLDNIYDMSISKNITYVDTYCITGRVTRMINTFEGIEFEDINIFNKVDISTIRSEMLNKCALIRNNNPDCSNEYLQKLIKNALYKDYVDSKIISKEELDADLNTWINNI